MPVPDSLAVFSLIRIMQNFLTTHLDTIITAAQITLSVLLIASILLQARGAGLGGAFGGEGNVYRTKRGVEKTLFRATIVISILFFGVALANVLV